MDAFKEFYRQYPLATAGTLIATLGLLRSSLLHARRPPLPPGPRGLPFIGSALHIPTEEPWRTYHDWSKKYGDVIYFEALGNKFLVLNSLEATNTLLVERSANYSDRMSSAIIDLSRHDWSFAFMNYGQQWRDHRRTFHRFFSPTEVHKMHPIIEEEIPTFLKYLLSQPEDFRAALRRFFGTVIIRAAYGIEDAERNRELTADADSLFARLLEVMTPGNFLVGYLPSMRYIPTWLPGAGWKHVLEEFGCWNDRFINDPFNDTKAGMRKGTQPRFRSMAVELIRDLPDEASPDFKYKETVAKNATAAAYIAGVDTTLSSALAVILAIAMYPEVQRKAQEELDQVIGQDRLPTPSDFANLPYIQAIVKETARWHTVVPMAMIHVSREEDVYNGMRIPAGTMVFPNGWAVMHSPKIFDDPFEFIPERYLKDGKIDRSVMDPEATVFGYGRRICPGRYMSNDTLTSMTAALLACFNISPVEGKEPLSLKISTNTTCYPTPFECKIEPRSEHHLALVNNL